MQQRVRIGRFCDESPSHTGFLRHISRRFRHKFSFLFTESTLRHLGHMPEITAKSNFCGKSAFYMHILTVSLPKDSARLGPPHKKTRRQKPPGFRGTTGDWLPHQSFCFDLLIGQIQSAGGAFNQGVNLFRCDHQRRRNNHTIADMAHHQIVGETVLAAFVAH